MQKLAIVTAVASFIATPATAQYAYGPAFGAYFSVAPYYSAYGPAIYLDPAAPIYGSTYVYGRPDYTYGYPYQTRVYSRALDIATEPDWHVRHELRRDMTQNLELQP